MDAKQIIPIFFTFDKNFIVPAAVTFSSLLEHADRSYAYKLYVVHADISLKKQKRLQRILKQYDFATLEFICADIVESKDWVKTNSKQHYSKEIFNKLIAAELFPQYDKIICSDVDVLFMGDISKSYSCFDADECFFVAGVTNHVKSSIISWYKNFTQEELLKIEKGVGAGYLVFNLKQIRKKHLQQLMIDCYRDNSDRIIQPEQDVINLCCYPHISYLPMNYLVCVGDYTVDIANVSFVSDIESAKENFIQALQNPIQLHYAGFLKPWNSFFTRKQKLWFKELFRNGFFIDYLCDLPYFLYRRSKKYSLKRFIRKQLKMQ